jgi:hypothetical protein
LPRGEREGHTVKEAVKKGRRQRQSPRREDESARGERKRKEERIP